MGNRKEELQASVDLIWTLACETAPEGTDLRSDIEYGKSLVLAAPELLNVCRVVLLTVMMGKQKFGSEKGTPGHAIANALRNVIAKAEGEST